MSSKSKRNSILESLSPKERKALATDLEPVLLSKDLALFESGKRSDFVYFPIDAVISFKEGTGQRGSLEVWAVGRDGVAGFSAILGEMNPFRGVVLVPGAALKAKTSKFEAYFHQHSDFHDAIIGYYHDLLIQISYVGICNNSHSLVQRFSRWLLTMQERAGTNQL